MQDTALVVVVALSMAIGVVGTVVPFLPGLVLVWASALVYGIAAGFGPIGWAAFVVITALAVAGVVIGVVVPQRAAAAGGAPLPSLWAGAALGVAGFFLVPVVGIPLGFLTGILSAEWLRTRSWATAWRATLATLRGFGIATLAQFASALSMVTVWVVWVVAT
ncbi:MAG: DUF456 domain-containing protein [Acidimicrobiia bacterium]